MLMANRSERIRRFFFLAEAIFSEGSGFSLLGQVRRMLFFISKFLTLAVKYLGVYILDTLELFFGRNRSSRETLEFPFTEENQGVRVFVVWAKNCLFKPEDYFFEEHIFDKFKGETLTIVNCDCRKSDHSSLEFKAKSVIVRPNYGYDWGAYRDIILILANYQKN